MIYRRVSGSEEDTRDGRSISEKLVDKIIAAVWVALAVLVAMYTHFYSTITSSTSKGNHSLLFLFYALLGTNSVLLIYLTVYLPRAKGLDSSAWDVYCPRVIPTMSFIGVLMFLVLIRAIWPVYGFLSPLLIGIETMGLLFGLQFIPSF